MQHVPDNQFGPIQTDRQVLPSEEALKELASRMLQELPQTEQSSVTTPQVNLSDIVAGYRQIMTALGYKLENPALADTPMRAAKALVEMHTQPVLNLRSFDEGEQSSGMIAQQGIIVQSLCEHHILPFFGTACVVVISDAPRVMGLSKFARIVKHCAAGLNTQERITSRIGAMLMDEKTCGVPFTAVGVSLSCYHTCMSLRGVRDTSAVTRTQFLGGLFKTDPAARAEFLSAIKHP